MSPEAIDEDCDIVLDLDDVDKQEPAKTINPSMPAPKCEEKVSKKSEEEVTKENVANARTALVKDEGLFAVRCVCHSLQLILKDCEQVTLVRPWDAYRDCTPPTTHPPRKGPTV